MKKLTIILLVLSINVSAQYLKKRNPDKFKIKSEFYAPGLIMYSAVITNNQSHNITDPQSVQLAVTSIAASTITYFVIKKVKKRIKLRCFKHKKFKHKF